MGEKRVHLEEHLPCSTRVRRTFCGLYSPAKMTDRISEVTCKRCLHGLRPEKLKEGE